MLAQPSFWRSTTIVRRPQGDTATQGNWSITRNLFARSPGDWRRVLCELRRRRLALGILQHPKIGSHQSFLIIAHESFSTPLDHHPTYKEAGNIKNLIEEILEYCDRDSLEILVVDDNSQDGIDEQIRLLYEQGINITLLQRLENRGLATAVKFGIDRAREVSSLHGCRPSRSTGCHPKNAEGFGRTAAVEVVVGSRYVEEGGFAGEWSQYRQWNSKISTMLANLVIHDLA